MVFWSSRDPDPVEPSPAVVRVRPRLGASLAMLAIIVVTSIGLVVQSSRPDDTALVAGEPYPTGGCSIDASYVVQCVNPATGQVITYDDPPSFGFAPGLGTLPSTFTVGGVQTATRTAAGATAAGSACRDGACFYLTGVAAAAIAWLGFDFAADRTADNMAKFNPDPDPGAPPVIQYPCSHMTINMTAGSTTISAVQVVTQAYQVGAPNAQALNSELCNSNAVYTIYAKDGAGLMHRCQTTYSVNVYYGPTYGYAASTKTGLTSASCTGSWVVQGIVAIPQPSGASNNVGEGYGDGVVTKGTFNPGETSYRTEKRCEYSGGSWDVMAREDIGRIVFKGCTPPVGQTARGTLATVYARVVVEDGWLMVDQYDLGAPPEPSNTTNYPSCYVVTNGTTTNVCSWHVEVDGQPCRPGGSQACYDWTTTRQTDSSRVRCLMGPYVMPADQCNWLEGWYTGGSYPFTGPNVDGNPATWEGPKPAWNPIPAQTATPTATSTATVTVTESPTSTAEPSPDPSTQTATQTQTQTQTATATSTATATATSTTGTGTDTGTLPGSAGQPSMTDVSGTACWPEGWAAFNPAEWVLQPIRCAFVPSTSATQAHVDSVTTKLGQAGPGPIITQLGDNFSLLSGGGCQGPNMPFNLSGVHEDIHPVDACSGAMATAAGYSKALSSVVIVFAGGVSIIRAIASAFGLSFTMGKGGDEA